MGFLEVQRSSAGAYLSFCMCFVGMSLDLFWVEGIRALGSRDLRYGVNCKESPKTVQDTELSPRVPGLKVILRSAFVRMDSGEDLIGRALCLGPYVTLWYSTAPSKTMMSRTNHKC